MYSKKSPEIKLLLVFRGWWFYDCSGFRAVTPTRSRSAYSKQVCL